MDSVILISPKSFDWNDFKSRLLSKNAIMIDTHLGQNYIERMLKSKKINATTTPNYVGTGVEKRRRGWIVKLNTN